MLKTSLLFKKFTNFTGKRDFLELRMRDIQVIIGFI